MGKIYKHCCAHMDRYTAVSEEDCLIQYSACTRGYNFLLRENGEYSGLRQSLWYCPWCGGELPKYLGEEWDECLLKEHGISDPGFKDESTLPAEFQTDEWWKKRGL